MPSSTQIAKYRKHSMRRRLAASGLSFLLGGCASPKFKPLDFAPDKILQDPMPGLAIIYLLRIPSDTEILDIYIDDKKAVTLPPSSFSVVVLKPGTRSIRAATPKGFVDQLQSAITVSAGERRFIYTSFPSEASVITRLAPYGIIGALPLLILPLSVPAGVRRWTECTELDAQGLMSNSTFVLAERGAA